MGSVPRQPCNPQPNPTNPMPKKKLPGLARTTPRSHLRLVAPLSHEKTPDSEPPPPAPGGPVVRLQSAPAPSRALLEDDDCNRRAA